MPSQEASRDYYVDQIHRNGYVSVDFPVNGADIDPLFASFRSLVTEVWERPNDHSQDIVDAFSIKHWQRPADSAGFIDQRRIDQYNRYDPGRAAATEDKDILHFTSLTASHVYEYLRTRGGQPRIVRELIKHCVDLQEAVRPAVQPALEALGVAEHLLAPKGLEIDNIHVLRILHYLAKPLVETRVEARRDKLSELHFDRSKFTAAVWESGPGLVGAPGNNGYGKRDLLVEELEVYAKRALNSPIKHTSRSLKLFAGAGYNRLPAPSRQVSGNLPLLLHGVTNDFPNEERDAVVLFMNEHVGKHDASVPAVDECRFGNIRASVAERQLRHGGIVAEV
jgi:hypothetical protein